MLGTHGLVNLDNRFCESARRTVFWKRMGWLPQSFPLKLIPVQNSQNCNFSVRNSRQIRFYSFYPSNKIDKIVLISREINKNGIFPINIHHILALFNQKLGKETGIFCLFSLLLDWVSNKFTFALIVAATTGPAKKTALYGECNGSP